jgi:DNA-binding response OmpR family regulator
VTNNPVTNAPSIVLIDADLGLRASLADQLRHSGRYRVTDAPDLAPLSLEPADLVLIAVEGGGLAMLAELRRTQPALPIIALVASGGDSVADATVSLERPFRLSSLFEAIDRGLAAPGVWRIGSYALQMREKRLVWSDGPAPNRLADPIRLTEKEALMLECLARADGAVVPRDQLLTDVWGYQPGLATHTLETHVYRLRRKIEARELRLVTEPGGYRLTV